MSYFVHPNALCESSAIGSGTKVWAFTHIYPGVKIGEDCNICDFVSIETGAVVGSRVTIKSGVFIWSGITIMDDVFIGPNVSFTNDKYPKSRNKDFVELKTVIESGVVLGANSTILPGIRIGMNAVVGAGAVVVKDIAAGQTVIGNPAHKM
jgi:acetyltransferase-like isoleucine patch superfamily enzyme